MQQDIYTIYYRKYKTKELYDVAFNLWDNFGITDGKRFDSHEGKLFQGS